MEIKDFINKIVVSQNSGEKMFITDISGAYIKTQTTKPAAHGYYTNYRYDTINGDPIKNGYLIFEDPSLKDPFIEAYERYSNTEDARFEVYEYWMRKD